MKNTNNNNVKNAKNTQTNGVKNVKSTKNCGGKCSTKSTKDCK